MFRITHLSEAHQGFGRVLIGESGLAAEAHAEPAEKILRVPLRNPLRPLR
jgi:hypothetical protein